MSLESEPSNLPGARAATEDLLAHASWVRGVAYRLVQDASTADDVVQEVWLAALARPPATDRPLRPWFAGVVRNLVRQRRRGESRRARREEVVATRRASETLPTPDELAARLETQQRLAEHVRALPEPYRGAVLLRWYEGLDGAEIARRQGIPAGTVRWRLSRALDLLRERLDEEHDGDRRAWCLGLIPIAASHRGAPGPADPVNPAPVTAALGSGIVAAVVQGVLAMGVGTKIAIAGAALIAALAALVATDVIGGAGETAPVTPVQVAFVPLDDPGTARRHVGTDAETATVDAPPADTPPERAGPQVVVEGRAVDEHGTPLEGVLVRAESNDETTTDAGGRFTLRSSIAVAFSRLGLTLSAPGRATATTEAPVSTRAPVPVGDIALGPGGAVSGRVTDDAGRPLGSAWVAFDDDRGADMPYAERRRLITAWGISGRRARTAADGTFRLVGVPAGVTRLWAGETDRLATVSGPVEIRAGMESRGVVIALPVLPPEQLITGRVVAPDGSPVPEADLRYEFDGSWGRSGSGSRSVSADGSFRIVLSHDGTYRFTARDRLDRWGAASVDDIEGGARDVVIRLPEVRLVRVAVVDRGGRPVPDFTASLQDHRRGALFEHVVAEHAADGAASMRIPAQEFFVSVEAPGYAESVLGPYDPDHLPDEIRVELDGIPGVRGVVTDGERAVVGARVTVHRVVPPGESVVHNGFAVRSYADSVAEGVTGDDGIFDLTVREKGDYVVRAVAEGYAPAESGDRSVDPAAGLSGVDLVLGRGGAIEGVVAADSGRSAAGTIVGISRGDGFAVSQRVGAHGAFRFDGLMPGMWEVRRLEEDIVPGSSSTFTGRGEFTVAWSCRVVEGGVTHHDLRAPSAGDARVSGALRLGTASAEGWTATLLLGPGPARRRGATTTIGPDGAFELADAGADAGALALTSPDGALRFLVDPVLGRVDLDIPCGEVLVRGVPDGRGPEGGLALVWLGDDGVVGLSLLGRAGAGDETVLAPDGRCRLSRLAPGAERDPATWEVLREVDVVAGERSEIDLGGR